MMKQLRLSLFGLCVLSMMFCCANAQTANAAQQVTIEGLRSANNYGNFTAAQYAADGSLYLLLDEHDGIRLLKTAAAGTTLLAQSQQGSAGDVGLSMALDPAGNVYVAGTSTSGMLAGTSGAAFPTRADTSTNSFLAKYDANLNLIFLTFLGAGRTAVACVAATADSAFVTGITFNAAFPVTPAGIQQAPAAGSSENGFVERFSADGSTLVYATYLTGVNGNTTPTGIVADSSDNATVTGSTSSSGYPTVSALVPAILGSASGFLTGLTPGGDGFRFSTFLPGNGMTSIALDATTPSLLVAGNVALGQFPVATVAMPLTSASYQSMLRIAPDGQSLLGSVLLVPGTQSFLSTAPDGSAWVSGSLTTPLFPAAAQPEYDAGDSFLLHVTTGNTLDQALRFGGLPAANTMYSSLTSIVAAPAVASSGTAAALPGTIAAGTNFSLLASQGFDLPMVQTPNAVLPSTLANVLPSAASCTSGNCAGSAGLLALVSTASAAPSLAVSISDLPNLTLRNLGSATASGLTLAATGYALASDCGVTLDPSEDCNIALTGSGPGSLTVSASNAESYTLSLPATTSVPDAVVLSTDELDFGIVSSASGTVTRTLTVTNLNTSSEVFSSTLETGATTPYTFTQAATDCPANGASAYLLAAGASCHITVGLAASTTSTNDGAANGFWKIGSRDVKLTGFAQAAALNVSATEVDFGTQYSGASALRLPRYLYLSNNSTSAVPHALVALPDGSPFIVVDNCPETLEPQSVCQIELGYLSPVSPSSDAVTLTLDDDISVLVTGQTLPPAGVTGSANNPNLTVTPTSLTFGTAVAVSGVSATMQTVTIGNIGSSAFPLAITVSGDFNITNGCPASLGAGATCEVEVSFTPTQTGERDGLLSITAGSSFTPSYVTLTGTGSAILPPNDGTLDLGQTVVGEPTVGWYKVQQAFPSLTVSSSNPAFGVILVEDTGQGYGTPPLSSFAQTATGTCNNCYIGVQFLSQTAGPQSATLTIATTTGGTATTVTVTADAISVDGLFLTPLTQDFGTVAVHSSSSAMIFTLANLLSPAGSVTVTSITATGDFSIAPNATGGASCSAALASTASCYVELVFAPTGTGLRTGTLSVVTSEGTATASLTGYGVSDSGLALNPDALVFENVPGNGATQQTIRITNTSAVAQTLGMLVVSDPSFSLSSTCGTLAPAATCSITVQFAPQNGIVNATLSIPITFTQAGQTATTLTTVPLTGAYTVEDEGLQLLPGQVNYGANPTSALGLTRQFTVNNLATGPLDIILTLPRQFPLVAGSNTCSTLSGGGSCTFAVSFLPSTAGALTGTVFAAGTPSGGGTSVQALAYVFGYGTSMGSLAIAGNLLPDAPLDFGNVTSGQTTQQTLTLTNSGTSNVTVRRITSDPPFLSTSACAATLAPNASCTITLTYAPIYEVTTGTGPRTDVGAVIVESDAASGPLTLDLTGTATPVVSGSPSSSAMLAAFELSQGSLSFATTTVGDVSVAQTVTLTNTGNTTVHILSSQAPTDFTATTNCDIVLPGDTCTFTVTFTPTIATASTLRSGTLEIASDAATSLEFITLIGTASPSPLAISPVALDFGTVNVGSTDSLGVSVTNSTNAAVTFNSTTATGDYSVALGTCPASGAGLAGGASCTVQVTFKPTAAGTRTGTLSIATNATTLPLTVSLTGNAVLAQLQVTPGALAFGSIAVGSPSSLSLTLKNTGTANVTGIMTSLTGTNSADFSVTMPCSSSSLAPGATCSVTVTFTPSALGARAARLSITSSDPASPALVSLTGTGTQPGSFMLSVSGGGNATTVTVAQGTPAAFPLTLTPLNGFTGAVALTCMPIVPAQYAGCSLLSSTLTLNGNSQTSTATITTITSDARKGAGAFAALGLLLMPLLVLGSLRRKRDATRTAVALLLGLFVAGVTSGCGGSSKVRYTPAGTYQYQVTATSTSGPQVSSMVTLNLIVQ